MKIHRMLFPYPAHVQRQLLERLAEALMCHSYVDSIKIKYFSDVAMFGLEATILGILVNSYRARQEEISMSAYCKRGAA